MSDATNLSSSVSSLRRQSAIDAMAAAWVVRRREALDAESERELAAWQAASPAHAEALARLSAINAALDRARSSGAGEAIVTQLRIRERRRKGRRRLLGAAASLAILGAGVGWWRQARHALPEEATIAASRFEPIRRLPDGSIVELNAGADIAVKYSAKVRQVELLRGEALFRVEKDAARPFVVRVAGIDVSAVGTAFSVRLANAAVEVLVTEGRVGVADAVRGESLVPPRPGEPARVLVAGQKLTVEPTAAAEAHRAAQVAEVSADEIKRQLAWRLPRLEFDGIELARAIAQLNATNRQQIVIRDENVGRRRISGTFAPDDPQTFARLAAASLGLRLEQRENEIILSAAAER